MPRGRCRSRARPRSRVGQVPIGLFAGGKEIRTVGPDVKEKPFRRAIWLLFARTYRTSGTAWSRARRRPCRRPRRVPVRWASSRPPSQGKIATPEIRRAKNSGPRRSIRKTAPCRTSRFGNPSAVNGRISLPPSFRRSSHASAGRRRAGIDIDDVGRFERDSRAAQKAWSSRDCGRDTHYWAPPAVG